MFWVATAYFPLLALYIILNAKFSR